MRNARRPRREAPGERIPFPFWAAAAGTVLPVPAVIVVLLAQGAPPVAAVPCGVPALGFAVLARRLVLGDRPRRARRHLLLGAVTGLLLVTVILAGTYSLFGLWLWAALLIALHEIVVTVGPRRWFRRRIT